MLCHFHPAVIRVMNVPFSSCYILSQKKQSLQQSRILTESNYVKLKSEPQTAVSWSQRKTSPAMIGAIFMVCAKDFV